MDLDQLTALWTPSGGAALVSAVELADDDPLAAASALRSRGVPAGLASAALTQAQLRRAARTKFGPDAARMYFTRAGLQQATRPAVAARRAARLAAAGVRTVADLGCGVGADAIAFARAGLRVHAVDADPVTAAVATANVAALGLDDRVEVSCQDARTTPLDQVDAVFCDPARRSSAGRRIFDPASYSPPWDFVIGLVDRVPATVLKLGPGIDHALIPTGTEAEWVSVDGDVVEAALWGTALAHAPRRATLITERRAHRPGLGPADDSPTVELTGSGKRTAPVGPVGRYLYDPDGAVVRAHLVAELADLLDGRLADPTIAYIHADEARLNRYARCYEIDEVLPFSLKRLRAALRTRGVGRLAIAKRGSAMEPEQLRRDLRLSGPAEATVVLTRVAGAPVAIICQPVH